MHIYVSLKLLPEALFICLEASLSQKNGLFTGILFPHRGIRLKKPSKNARLRNSPKSPEKPRLYLYLTILLKRVDMAKVKVTTRNQNNKTILQTDTHTFLAD